MHDSLHAAKNRGARNRSDAQKQNNEQIRTIPPHTIPPAEILDLVKTQEKKLASRRMERSGIGAGQREFDLMRDGVPRRIGGLKPGERRRHRRGHYGVQYVIGLLV